MKTFLSTMFALGLLAGSAAASIDSRKFYDEIDRQGHGSFVDWKDMDRQGHGAFIDWKELDREGRGK